MKIQINQTKANLRYSLMTPLIMQIIMGIFNRNNQLLLTSYDVKNELDKHNSQNNKKVLKSRVYALHGKNSLYFVFFPVLCDMR